MTSKPTLYRRLLDSQFYRAFHRFLWASIVASTVAALPFAAHSDDPDSAHNHATSMGHANSSDPEVKRQKKTGKGMPSIEGPFPDTVNMEFLGQLTNAELGVSKLVFTGASFLSDIWGWTSPYTDDEYAIVGTSSGVAFARITDPFNPVFLGLVPTTDTSTTRNFWWDIKTYKNYAYWVTEVNGAGVAIFNLMQLDDLPQEPANTQLQADARYYGYKGDYLRAHNISINEDTGFAYLTGASKVPGSKGPGSDLLFTDDGVIILDLKDPLAPKEVGQILGIDSHDAQVVTYHGPDEKYKGQEKEIAVIFNGTDLEVGIYDVTDKKFINVRTDASITISETTYDGASFTHQGWLTEDHKYMIMGDEEDELFGVSDPKNPNLPKTARTYIWDLLELEKPMMINTFDSPAASIDHNLFVKFDEARERDLVYQAHYTAGIRVLEIKKAAGGKVSLSEVAHMDTEPRLPNNHMNHNINIFVGPWGVYPFFDSGTIIASDGLNGLIITKLPVTE